MLHITNGDSVVGSLTAQGIPGDKLPWRDVLHEGPVPAGFELEALSRVRADFIASRGWGDVADVHESFRRRDEALSCFGEHEEIVLWFEHDLYDQLQLIQLLAWIASRERNSTRITLVQSPDHLGSMRPPQLGRLLPKRRPVTAAQLELGARVWDAFRAPDPAGLLTLLEADTSVLPFLDGALVRLLEHYPSQQEGLSRTERQALLHLGSGSVSLAELFVAATIDSEERHFLGDRVFQSYLEDLACDPSPLIEIDPAPEPFFGRRGQLTAVGRAVLAGQADAIRLRSIDRWIGGVHLQGPEAAWRWDRDSLRLVRS